MVFTWFGRDLSDADISSIWLMKSIRGESNRASADPKAAGTRRSDVKQWYPQIVGLAIIRNGVRLTAAWLMGFDPKSEEFIRRC